MSSTQGRPPARPTEVAVVVYGAKSTEDVHGSIPTQLSDCHTLAAREGWEVVGEFSDEAFSAYHGNRGPGLESAKALAVRTASERGRCILVAQDADRFARGAGDAPGAADHLGEIYFALRRQSVALWSVRSGELDLLRAALEGERATSESARKSQATRAGLKRRAERGKAIGAIPIGYTTEGYFNDEGKACSHRVVDPVKSATVSRIFELASEGGRTPGGISRTLNSEGHTTLRGGQWTTRAVRDVLRNRDYLGVTGYPPLVDAETFESAQQILTTLDQSAVQARKGGRPSAEDFPLAGMVFCSICGASMRVRRCSTTGRRTYRCRDATEGRSACPDSRPVDAVQAEQFLIGALGRYRGQVEDFLAEQQAGLRAEQTARMASLKELRRQAARLERTRSKLLADYRTQIEQGRSTAHLALEVIEGLDTERSDLEQAIADVESVIAEHTGEPDLDAARDLYARLMAVAERRVAEATSPGELKQVMRRIFSAVRMFATETGRVIVEADIRVPEADVHLVESEQETHVHRRVPTTLPLPVFSAR